jgi:glycosyltransferase involved in cell wall biosynthesis
MRDPSILPTGKSLPAALLPSGPLPSSGSLGGAPSPGVLLIEGSDFETFPVGGQLTMVRCLMKLFGPRVALVGMSKDGETIGQWMQKEIDGRAYWFLPVCRRQPLAAKPLIPARVSFYRGLRRFRRQILKIGCRNVFIQGLEVLLAVANWPWDSLCFDFPGVENPLRISRYWYARHLSALCERRFFAALDHVDVVFATADQASIARMVARSNGRLSPHRVFQLPTSVDTDVFHPAGMHKVRRSLGISLEAKVFVNAGRIGRFKGWEFLIDSFAQFESKRPGSLLIFAGDGEDRDALLAHAKLRNVASCVRITGFLPQSGVAEYLNAADVVLFGSFAEGWCTAMIEALACGKPLVSTPVSGTGELIQPNGNGFVVNDRDPAQYCKAMEEALALPGARQISLEIAAQYDLPHMGERLAQHWPPFRDPVSKDPVSRSLEFAQAAPPSGWPQAR